MGWPDEIAPSLEELAWLAARRGESRQATRILAAADEMRRATNSPFTPIERERRERSITEIQQALGDAEFAAAWAAGAAMSGDEAVAYALATTPVEVVR